MYTVAKKLPKDYGDWSVNRIMEIARYSGYSMHIDQKMSFFYVLRQRAIPKRPYINLI